jgi:hypothetical protein
MGPHAWWNCIGIVTVVVIFKIIHFCISCKRPVDVASTAFFLLCKAVSAHVSAAENVALLDARDVHVSTPLHAPQTCAQKATPPTMIP